MVDGGIIRLSLTINIKNYESVKIQSSDLKYEDCLQELLISCERLKKCIPEMQDKLLLLIYLRDSYLKELMEK